MNTSGHPAFFPGENKISGVDSTGCLGKPAWEKPEVQKLSVGRGTSGGINNVVEVDGGGLATS
ncbi:MAG TPA: hypothetical protein VNW30_07200 [Opitutaceae bacterium]|jgi:hypothetical protein|nr:hypothetical protein [Opitutaceae bacterium]